MNQHALLHNQIVFGKQYEQLVFHPHNPSLKGYFLEYPTVLNTGWTNEFLQIIAKKPLGNLQIQDEIFPFFCFRHIYTQEAGFKRQAFIRTQDGELVWQDLPSNPKIAYSLKQRVKQFIVKHW